MVTLQGLNIYLRALEPEDLEFIYRIENDENIWEVSNTQTPYSKFLIRQYLEMRIRIFMKPNNCVWPSAKQQLQQLLG